MTPAAIRSLAARLYDDLREQEPEARCPRALAFLDAIGEADKAWREAVTRANIEYGGGTEAWSAVKNLATRQMEADYAKALAVYQADEIEEVEYAEAAE